MSDALSAGMPLPVMKTPAVYVSGKHIYASGSILSRFDESIKIYPLGPPIETYAVELRFDNNPLLQSVINSYVAYDGIIVVFQNMSSQFGTSNIEPLHVANYYNRMVFATFAYYIVGAGPASVRVTHYTFYDGGPVVTQPV